MMYMAMAVSVSTKVLIVLSAFLHQYNLTTKEKHSRIESDVEHQSINHFITSMKFGSLHSYRRDDTE